MTLSNSASGPLGGIVYLVGAGPGDPGLLTVKGMQCLRKADVVVYDYLSDPSLLSYAPENAEKIYVGKSASQHTMEQDQINDVLVARGLQGKTTVRLKGGDPFVFGRGGEECEALRKAGVPYEIVPGITAGIAAPAYAGIPVTHRKVASSMALITGNEDPTKPDSAIHWEHLTKGVDTLVFYMGVSNLQAITAELMKHGRSPETPVAVVRWGTKSRQQVVVGTIATIADIAVKAALKPPAITIVGEVVNLREQLEWFERRPLFGKRIINTRTREQASELSGVLSALGAEVVELPTIAITPAGTGGDLDQTIDRISGFDWLIFTSPNGVQAFFDLFFAKGNDIRSLGAIRIASIGPGTTAAITRLHLTVEITAKDAVAEGLIDSLRTCPSWKGKNVLLPRAEKARDILPDTLESWGAKVSVVTAYTTTPPRELDMSVIGDMCDGHYDCITFSSSSTFENFVALIGNETFQKIRPSLKAASIGPVTTATMTNLGVQPMLEAKDHTRPGLAAAIKEYLSL